MTSGNLAVEPLSHKEDEQEHPLERSQFTYTPCYCEENIYMLCKQLCEYGIAASEASDLFVVFISNAKRKVPIWRQKASSSKDGLVVWDYHVICIQKSSKNGQGVAWDLDTTLPFPISFNEYVKQAFCPWLALSPSFKRLFRVVAAPVFIRYFASDRRHMRTSEGLWNMPPPKYDCIVAEDGAVHNLEDYIAMSEENVLEDELSLKGNVGQRYGVVLRERGLQHFFNSV